MSRLFLSVFFTILTTAAFAQDENAALNIGGDAFMAGSSISHTQGGMDDVFMAGETVDMAAPITGSAHLAGRSVNANGAIGQDVYAAGMDVTVAGDVTGDATLAGYTVKVNGPVGGDLRASGATITVDGPVAGYGLITGETLTLNSVISGDVSMSGMKLNFGPDARIGGKLTLYEEEGKAVEVPDYVIAQSDIERRPMEAWHETERGVYGVFSWRKAITKFLMGVVFVALIAALIAAIAPNHLRLMRERMLAAPFRTLWFGFLTQSAVIGSAILFALTIVGIFVAPAAILLALLGGLFGYIIGAYSFGVGLLLAIGQDEPEALMSRVIAAFVGALAVGLIGLIPILGWIFVLALTLAGIGAIIIRVFRPTFFSPAAKN